MIGTVSRCSDNFFTFSVEQLVLDLDDANISRHSNA